ncbi:MAG TPA: AI-2E family transporter [Candidatus Saccharicenans sp.]|nr:AI-2E family transporter [Candidatus Saccharicenans sp.]
MAEVTVTESKLTRVCLVILTLFVLGICFKLARPVLVPFFLSLFISYAISPLLDWLISLKVPKGLAITLIVVVTFGLLYLIGLILYSSGKHFVASLPAYTQKITDLLTEISSGLDHLPFKLDVPSIIGQINLEKVTNVLFGTLGSFFNFLGNLILIFVFIIFILAGRDKLADKVARAFAPERASYLSRVLLSLNSQIQKYLAVKTLLSIINGTLVCLILIIFGVDFALLLGFLTFVLNFIPSFGSIIATIIPTLVAFLQFGNSLTPIWVLLAIGVTDSILGNFVDPKLMGHSLDLSPLLVLFTLILWGWLWGIAGMVLAVPILAVLKIILENIPSTRSWAILMSK